MADLPGGLQLRRLFIGMAALVLFKPPGVLGVHQEEVEILHSAGRQLTLHQGHYVILGLEVSAGELVR